MVTFVIYVRGASVVVMFVTNFKSASVVTLCGLHS
jgi:hypothetical protein